MRNRNLAFSTLGCPDWDFETVVKNASAMGFAAVEVRGLGKELRAERLPCFFPERQRETQALLEKYGVGICGINTSCCFHDREKLDESLAEGRAAIALCQRMGIPQIRVFGDLLPPENPQETIRQAAEGIAALCGEAEAAGFVQVLLEIHGDFNRIEVLEELLPLLAGHPSFGILWDIEHSFRAYGQDEQGFYRLIRPYIRHVHIKDCRAEGSALSIEKPGEGEIPIPRLAAALERDGYSGLYSFEWEKRWHPELARPEEAFPAYVAYMKKIGGRFDDL